MSMSLLAAGVNADVYVDGDKAIKLFRENVPKTTVLYEALTQSRIEAAGLSVPVIHEVSVVDGRWAITMDYISGKSYSDLISENPDRKDKYLEELVDIQIEIHCTSSPKISKLTDKLTRLINENRELDEIKKYELLTRIEGMPKHTKLCHCNYTPENVILNDKGVFILGWRNARLGNASADVANSFLLFALKDRQIAQTYLDLFCESTCTPKKYVQKWLPIIAAARCGLGIPEEKDLLHNWLDVVEY